ncbi:60S ribosomal L6-like [Olea europaea subsp. europaea]|uniref:60S ribosomal L6-like n=1 Tax=Olea europaea subsp. europaea TaxID=158383 RepID=A0A8S0SKV6_OLEEU|nr:60S ribosomal L6-like [Olea europaea subsp. europaea]
MGYQGQKWRQIPNPQEEIHSSKASCREGTKFYPADDVKKPLSNKRKHKPTKLRASITPEQLLLVTRRFKINGIPLQRVNQAYVVATSTKVDISRVNVKKLDDEYLATQAEKKKGETEFFEAKKEEKMCFQQRRKMTKKLLM